MNRKTYAARRSTQKRRGQAVSDFEFSDVKIALDSDDALFPAQREAMKQLYDSFLEANKHVPEPSVDDAEPGQRVTPPR